MKKNSAALLVLALTVSSSALVAGCADENDPKTWVSRLDDAAKRPAAVKRLGQFFEDTMTKANGDRNDASVKALLDTIAEPMAKVYATGSGDEKTRRELLKILSDLQDARTAPAFVRAFQDYEAGRNDDEVKNATAAIVSMAKKGQALDPALTDATFELFAKFRPRSRSSRARSRASTRRSSSSRARAGARRRSSSSRRRSTTARTRSSTRSCSASSPRSASSASSRRRPPRPRS